MGRAYFAFLAFFCVETCLKYASIPLGGADIPASAFLSSADAVHLLKDGQVPEVRIGPFTVRYARRTNPFGFLGLADGLWVRLLQNFTLLCFIVLGFRMSSKSRIRVWAQAAVACGAISNGIDRLLWGGVVDYILWTWGGAAGNLNCSDMLITAGFLGFSYASAKESYADSDSGKAVFLKKGECDQRRNSSRGNCK